MEMINTCLNVYYLTCDSLLALYPGKVTLETPTLGASSSSNFLYINIESLIHRQSTGRASAPTPSVKRTERPDLQNLECSSDTDNICGIERVKIDQNEADDNVDGQQ